MPTARCRSRVLRHAVPALLLASFCGAQYPIGQVPSNATCAGSPPILSYHVHVVFEGKDWDATQQAFALYRAFVGDFNSSMELCPFSHPDPAAHYRHICPFVFNLTYPVEAGPVFNAANFAFFVPAEEATRVGAWWRTRAAGSRVDWTMHANSGCADRDHTEFSLFSYGYRFPINPSALWCCHAGPPGCSCDIVQYALPTASATVPTPQQLCLATGTNDPGTLHLSQCQSGAFGNATWRQTRYSAALQQVELYGDKHRNPGLCLGIAERAHVRDTNHDACTQGALVSLVPCVQHAASRVSWRASPSPAQPPSNMTESNRGAGTGLTTGQLVVDTCPGLCIGVPTAAATDASRRVQLVQCSDSATMWSRSWLRG